ncbi:imelysin family protein [Parendozoicomonas haliclonae]|uniref:Iron-regulated protein A n=2 Tax=Parendozoicomonas haliclonae TaxID=1960125 RepID=A0A1X7APP0_9GAMM|nr:Iron-regulated protein A precursor [Parendozoicomonas haliclonae]
MTGRKSLLSQCLCLGLCSVFLLSGCQPKPPSSELQLAESTTAVAQPLYNDLVVGLKEFHSSASSFCSAPSAGGLAGVQQQWHQSMLNWQSASVVNFGPVTMDSMAWKFQFWPDKKNLIHRKVESEIRRGSQSEAGWTPASIGKVSVVSRGFGAAEYLLFDPEAKEKIAEPVRCEYLQVVIQDMQRNAERLSRWWQQGEDRYPEELKALADAVPATEESYPQVSALLVSSLHTTLETAIRKLSMPLGKTDQHGNPYMSESWRSGYSLDNLRAVIASTRKLYEGGEGYGLDERLASVDEESRQLAEEISIAYDEVDKILASKPLENISLKDAVVDPERREVLSSLLFGISRIKNLFAGKVPDKLGIPLGFNSNDGD